MSYPGSGRADYFALGDWNVVCYQCGRKRKASTVIKHWQGYYVCKEHWEPRQPQDFVRNVPDIQTPPWAQPMPAPVFRTYCTIEGSTGITGIGIAGCAVAGRCWGGIGAPIPSTYANVGFGWSNQVASRPGQLVSIVFRSTGIVATFGHSYDWYAPTTTGIGNSYWIKATKLSGNFLWTGVFDTILPLSVNQTWAILPTDVMEILFTIYGDAAGLTEIGAGTMTLDAS